MAGTSDDDAAEDEQQLAPPVFVRELAGGTWEVVDAGTDAAIGEAHASRNAALDAALAELGDVLKTPHLKDAETGEAVGQWRWLDATSEEPEDAALDEDGEVVRMRITAAAIDSMAADLNAGTMPRPIDGGIVPPDLAPSDPHGTYYDSGTPANGWAHAGVKFVTAALVAHLALRAELWPTVAKEFDRGRLAYGSVHVEGDALDDTGGPEGATLESHALTNRPVVQTLLPSTAMLSRNRRAVVTLRGKGTKGMSTKKIITLRGPALDAITKLCTELGVSVTEEMEGDSWSSQLVDRIRALKQIAVGEQVLEQLPAGGGDAALAKAIRLARAKHLKRVAVALAEGDDAAATDDAATKTVAALQQALGLATPEEALAWVEAHAEELAALAADDTADDTAEGGEEGSMATKGKGTKLFNKLALSRLERLEAEAKKRAEDDTIALIERDVAAGKIATAEREEYLELARTNPALYARLTKNARAVPTGRVAQAGEARIKGGGAAAPHAELGLGPLTEAEEAKVRAMKAAKVSKAGIVRAIERSRAA